MFYEKTMRAVSHCSEEELSDIADFLGVTIPSNVPKEEHRLYLQHQVLDLDYGIVCKIDLWDRRHKLQS